MPEMLLLALCAVICGAESWDGIGLFGKLKLMFLRQYLPYEPDIPSDDTLRRFFRAIGTTQFQRLLVERARARLMCQHLSGHKVKQPFAAIRSLQATHAIG